MYAQYVKVIITLERLAKVRNDPYPRLLLLLFIVFIFLHALEMYIANKLTLYDRFENMFANSVFISFIWPNFVPAQLRKVASLLYQITRWNVWLNIQGMFDGMDRFVEKYIAPITRIVLFMLMSFTILKIIQVQFLSVQENVEKEEILVTVDGS
ncbi:hypothetical protein FDP41_011355 [Naegleria fowleri]|uniref:Uncharacterized protein n=1 Tax=Naegleria fowleri TaxID=5763 RepID=A0A6A5CAL6_NAEFO|nr:uncharacterized protein FDP41_011355 [Naegleria fowleri]KAF0982425.1 hypothetical protein FDP41_011355 [Naegleria fowleri]CAG4714961.1 unnamed protein product [Naegleria fowleri]